MKCKIQLGISRRERCKVEGTAGNLFETWLSKFFALFLDLMEVF